MSHIEITNDQDQSMAFFVLKKCIENEHQLVLSSPSDSSFKVSIAFHKGIYHIAFDGSSHLSPILLSDSPSIESELDTHSHLLLALVNKHTVNVHDNNYIQCRTNIAKGLAEFISIVTNISSYTSFTFDIIQPHRNGIIENGKVVAV